MKEVAPGRLSDEIALQPPYLRGISFCHTLRPPPVWTDSLRLPQSDFEAAACRRAVHEADCGYTEISHATAAFHKFTTMEKSAP